MSSRKINQLYNGNIIFIGESGVGKTALINRLLEKDFIPTESELTRGVNIYQWRFIDENENEVQISLTDIGGQEIVYSLYHLFFRNNSVYVYVQDSRKESDIEFWLSQVSQYSKNSFVIIVQNKIDTFPATNHLNQPYLKSKYPNIVSFINVSAATNVGIDELQSLLVNTIKKVPSYGQKLPVVWTRIILEIFELSESYEYITFQAFKELCSNHNIVDDQSIYFLASYLHDTGRILHFHNDLVLSSIILLNMDWLLSGIYTVLSSQILLEEKGELSIDQINKILNSYSNHEQSIFIQILLIFELGYRLKKGNFIFPIGFPNTQPVKEWNIEGSYKFEYHFQTIPFGLIERFIVRNYQKIDISQTWRNGTVIDFRNSKTLLVSDKFERKIRIWILGDLPKEILAFVSNEIEDILNSYEQVDFKKLIPCICETCMNSNPYLYDFEILKMALSKGMNSIQCGISFTKVEIDRLLFNPSSSKKKIEKFRTKKSDTVEYEWSNLNNLFFEFHYTAQKIDVFNSFYEKYKDLNSKIIYPNLHIVEFENSKAKIENEVVNQKVKITIEGDFKEDLLAILRHKVQLISNDRKIEFNKFVKCNCIECLNESYYFDFNFLRKRELKGKDLIICEKSANDVSIISLMGRHKSEKDNSGIFIVQNNQNLNDMKIENQNIYGGNIQFADLIINKSQVLDETDSRFLQLIHGHTSSAEERKALVENLEIVKSPKTPIGQKSESGKLLGKFADTVVTEGGKQLMKEIIESGAEYLQYIF